jgi:N-dimethylarginine dimethylaminohydrolase
MMYTAEAGEFVRTDDGKPAMLLPNMAVDHRRMEADWLGGFYAGLGFETLAIESTWEAQGDVIRGRTADQAIHTYGVGPEARTEQSAYDEVADLISTDHLHLPFDADPWFHGNTFMNVYRSPDPGSDDIFLMVCPDALATSEYRRLREFLGDPKVCEITPEQSLGYDTNALQVNDTILASDTLSETAAAAFDSLGLNVERLDFQELFEKGGGAPVCLTNRLWNIRDDEVPEHVTWSHIRSSM